MSPDEYCQRKAAQRGTSFHYAFLFLPAERRQAITALYAFCREVEAIVDETSEASVARMKLAWWRSQVSAMFDGQPDHPVAIALARHIAACHLTPDALYGVIEASEANLDQFRYADWPALREHCWRAAGQVGGLSAQIYGCSDAATLQHAQTLGLALQMTTILSDVGEDARRGRIYLPGDEMERHGVTVDDVLDSHHTPAFQALMSEQAQRTRDLFRQALQSLPDADRRAQRPGLILAAIHATLLNEMERDGWHVLDQRIALTPIRKFWLAWQTWVTNGRRLARILQA